MSNKNFSDLYNVIEKLRKECYPNIPSKLLYDILVKEQEHQDNEVEAYKNIKLLVEAELKKISDEDGE